MLLFNARIVPSWMPITCDFLGHHVQWWWEASRRGSYDQKSGQIPAVRFRQYPSFWVMSVMVLFSAQIVTSWTPITCDYLGHHLEWRCQAAKRASYDSKQWSNSCHAIQEIDVLLSGTMLDYSCVDARLVNRWSSDIIFTKGLKRLHCS